MCPDLAQGSSFNKMLCCGEAIKNIIQLEAEKHFHSLACFPLKGNSAHAFSVLSMNTSSGFKTMLYIYSIPAPLK